MSEAGPAPTLIEAVDRMRDAFARFGVSYALIGGMAFGLQVRPRATKDAHFLIAVPQIRLPALLDDLVENGFSLNPRTVIEEFVQHHMTHFVFSGARIDWLKPVVPAYQHVLDHAREEPFLGKPLRLASPEGLILLKLTASRPQDVADIAAILAANRRKLDMPWIEREWRTLYELDDPRWQRFQETVREFYECRPPAA